MGDMNAKVGEGRFENVVGEYGLGQRNERGERFIEWCKAKQSNSYEHLVQKSPKKKLDLEKSR